MHKADQLRCRYDVGFWHEADQLGVQSQGQLLDPRQTFRLAGFFPISRCNYRLFVLTPAVVLAGSIAELRWWREQVIDRLERSSLCRSIKVWARRESLCRRGRVSAKGARRIELKNLERKALAELAHAQAQGRALAPGFIDEVYAATEGNPLFAEQILKTNQNRDQRLQLAQAPRPRGLDLMRVAIPSTIEMAILQRADEPFKAKLDFTVGFGSVLWEAEAGETRS